MRNNFFVLLIKFGVFVVFVYLPLIPLVLMFFITSLAGLLFYGQLTDFIFYLYMTILLPIMAAAVCYWLCLGYKSFWARFGIIYLNWLILAIGALTLLYANFTHALDEKGSLTASEIWIGTFTGIFEPGVFLILNVFLTLWCLFVTAGVQRLLSKNSI